MAKMFFITNYVSMSEHNKKTYADISVVHAQLPWFIPLKTLQYRTLPVDVPEMHPAPYDLLRGENTQQFSVLNGVSHVQLSIGNLLKPSPYPVLCNVNMNNFLVPSSCSPSMWGAVLLIHAPGPPIYMQGARHLDSTICASERSCAFHLRPDLCPPVRLPLVCHPPLKNLAPAATGPKV